MTAPALNTGKYVFVRLASLLDKNKFDSIARNYPGNEHVRHLTCQDQLPCMVLGQLTRRESLGGLIPAIDAHRNKTYHLGLGKGATKGNLAKANRRGPCFHT